MSDIYPSLIAADQEKLQSILTTLDPYCPGYHIDVMDNQFVPNQTKGASWINDIARITQQTLWLHLMVNDPISIINKLLIQPHSMITIHVEAPIDHPAVLQYIHHHGYRAGIALNPKTPVTAITPLLSPIIDHILIMSVEPGCSGQPFIDGVIPKIDQLRQKKDETDYVYRLAIDGGITAQNIGLLRQKGIGLFAIGSALFHSDSLIKNLKKLE